jgi:hypothetical protein
MLKAIGRAAAAAIAGALAGAAAAALFYAWHPALTLEFDRDLPRAVSGIYPVEHDPSTRLTFAWTGDDAVIRLPGLDRRAAWTVEMRVRGGRTPAAANPALTVLADGVELATRATAQDFIDLTVTIPARPEHRGLTLGLRSSAAFVPGPGDPRRLGVMLDRLSLTPSRVALVPRAALDGAALTSAVMGAGMALLGMTAGSAIGAAVLFGTAAAAVMAHGFAPFTTYPDTAVELAWWIAGALALASAGIHVLRRQPLRNTARFAAAFSAAALCLKLLALLHPNMPIGDAMFHAHRFEGVLAGNLYFTSVAPGGYQFPYPPGLYVFASLFAGLVRRASDMALLRSVTAAADAAAGLLLYAVVAERWKARLAGAIAVAVYHLMPISFAVLATANLTNAFAQSLAVAAFALMAWPPAAPAPARWLYAAALIAAFDAAFLSHTSTLAILFTAAVLIALLLSARGDAGRRRHGAIVLACAVAAALVAIAVYYGHFGSTYRAEFARIGHETATAAADAGGRTIAGRLRAVPYYAGLNIGLPALLLALLGVLQMARQRAGDPLVLTVGGWLLSCVVFLGIGIATPVDMRYYLAALPALAIAAGSAAAWAWNDSPPAHRALWRLAAALLLAATISGGFRAWWTTLG